MEWWSLGEFERKGISDSVKDILLAENIKNIRIKPASSKTNFIEILSRDFAKARSLTHHLRYKPNPKSQSQMAKGAGILEAIAKSNRTNAELRAWEE